MSPRHFWIIFHVFLLTSGENVSLSDIDSRLDYLEERILSLEQPVWTVSWDIDRWRLCSERGPCYCDHLSRTINCWGLLSDSGIPSDQMIPADVQVIDLGSNDIPALSSSAFNQLSKLTELSLFSVHLKYIPKFSFRHLNELRYLKLSNNRITTIEPELFIKLRNLKGLDISSNRISKLPRDVFDKNVELETLQLSFNLIHEISDCPFDKLKLLKRLDLSKNKIKVLGPCFTMMQSLEFLDLSGNQLSSIEDTQFVGLEPSLSQLILSYNAIESIEESSFAALTHLTHLVLNNNAIRTLDPGILPIQLKHLDTSRNLIETVKRPFSPPIFGLSSLDLSYNNIEIVNIPVINEAFPRLEALKINNNLIKSFNHDLSSHKSFNFLDLQMNQLESLSELDLRLFSNVNRIRLEENLWKCDCNLLPFARWLMTHQAKVEDVDEIICFTPVDGRPVVQAAKENLEC